MSRRSSTGPALRFALFSAFILCVGTGAARAQQADNVRDYPSRPVRMVIGFTPGGQPDIVARMIAPRVGDLIGQQIVVDNRPGAGGTLGTRIVTESNPDGHTLLTSSSSIAISPVIYARLPYDTLRDLAGITRSYTAGYVLAAAPALGVKDLKSFVALAKAKPGQLNFSSAGTGSGMHFAGEMIKQTLHIDIVHVPYKGVPEAITDTIAGRVQFVMAPIGSTVRLVQGGQLRGLAVSLAKRVAVHPNLPTVAELGHPGFSWTAWAGIFAPAKTPRPIIDKLNHAFVQALREPETQQRMSGLGMEATPTTPRELEQFLAAQMALVRQLATKAGIKAK